VDVVAPLVEFFFYCWDFSRKNDLAAIYFSFRGQCF
jgi:hypothetical protein